MDGPFVLGWIVILAFLIILMLLVGLISLIEAVVLWIFKWERFSQSLVDSLIMNAILLIPSLFLACVILSLDIFFMKLPDKVFVPITLATFWGLSSILKSSAISIIRRKSLRSVLLPVFTANISGYVLVIIPICLWFLGL